MNESTTQQKWINGNGLRQAPVRATHISIYSLISMLHAISVPTYQPLELDLIERGSTWFW